METEIIKLYTKEEVIGILRLDTKNVKNPIDSLTYLIRIKQLKPVRICGELMFAAESIRQYIESCKN